VPLIAQEIPKIGLVMEAVKVVRWLKNVGDTVNVGQALLEVETEKSVLEIEAVASGRLTQILVQVDQEATVGDQVAWIDASVAARTDAPKSAAPDAPAATVAPPSTGATAVPGTGRIVSTPVARKLAAEHGLDLGAIAGTGPGGRVQLKDVKMAVGGPGFADSGGATPAVQPLSRMRRALARAMTLSVGTIPQFTVTRSVEWTALRAERDALCERLPAASSKLSLNDFLLQAVARALVESPGLNATFMGDPDSSSARIVPANGAHIGLVVAVDGGLLVPVIHDVDRLGLAEIARRREDCVERSVNGRLRSEETDRATISISNLGAAGPDRFTAIINPPQSAILAVGRQRDCVVAREGAIVVRPVSDLTLTVDHRVADGRLASQFLARVVAILEGRDWRLH
jgi:pyruvate dehydrogenase E2 component (dihydrolipoamide acetyltransferase)